MIPVTQTTLSSENGNCWAACVASIFEMPIDSVVDIFAVPETHWTLAVDEWLGRANLAMVRVPHGADIPNGLSILSCPSVKFPGCTHAVVCLDGGVVWDPNPKEVKDQFPDRNYHDGAGHYWVFHPRDPARPVHLDALKSEAV
jgi:hypothetical protein